MDQTVHKLELHLSSAGFDGTDVQALLPDFITERETIVGLSWYPCADGPERYYITISIFAAIGFVSKIFLEELSKDIYGWLKTRILPLMKEKPRSFGSMEVVFQDVHVWCCVDKDSDWLICAESLPALMAQVDIAQSIEWDIEISNGRITIEPRKQDSGA